MQIRNLSHHYSRLCLNKKLNLNLDMIKSNLDYYIPESNHKTKQENLEHVKESIINITNNMLDIIDLEKKIIYDNNKKYNIIEK
jgi:hypothetical protein